MSDKKKFQIAADLIKSGAGSDLRSLLQDMNIHILGTRKRTLLHVAASADNAPAVAILIELGADLTAGDYRENTALHLACDDAAVKATEKLVTASAPLDARNTMDFLPLHSAARGPRDHARRAQIGKLLVDAGSPLDDKTNAGRTALYLAAMSGNAGLAEVLLEAGADPALAPANRPDARAIAEERGFGKVVDVFYRLAGN